MKKLVVSALRITAVLLAVTFSKELPAQVAAPVDIITTFAGGGPNNLPALSANLNDPSGVAVDAAGNFFIAARSQHRVFKVDAAGQLTVVAGTGFRGFSGDGGPATSASFKNPAGVALDTAGNLLVADQFNSRIRRVDAATGIITTVAGNGTQGFSGDGGPATSAGLNRPTGVAVDAAGNLFIADNRNNRIRRVDAITGIIITVDAGFSSPIGVALDAAGNLFFGDTISHRIRRVDAVTGITTTVAGFGVRGFGGDGGPATSARLNGPVGVAVDAAGNLFIGDNQNRRIRHVDASTGIITTVAGNGIAGFSGDGGPATSASLRNTWGLALDAAGNLFIADLDNNRVRRVEPSGVINTVAGNGKHGFSGDGSLATSATLFFPSGVAVGAAGNVLIADTGNKRIRSVEAATGIISTVAGNGSSGFSGDGGPAINASFSEPFGVAVDAAGNLFISDEFNNRIRRVDAATGIITTVAGNGTPAFGGDGGPAVNASIAFPEGVGLDAVGNLFIAGSEFSRIRRVDVATGIITTVAGNGSSGFDGDGGLAINASIAFPKGVALDTVGNLFIADTSNSRVRRVDATTGIITTVAGNGTDGFSGDSGPATLASLSDPTGVALDAVGNLFIAEQSNQRVRRVDAATGIITTVAGNGTDGFSGDGGPATSARLAFPLGVAVNTAGTLFIADRFNQRIRRVTFTPEQQIDAIRDTLQAAVDSDPGTLLADKAANAAVLLSTALVELAKTPPDSQAALGNIEGAVGDLEAAVNGGLLDPVQDAQLIQLMDQLAAVARQLAVNAINEALAQVGDPTIIDEAEQELADGDVFRTSGEFKDAVNMYKNALAKGESALP